MTDEEIGFIIRKFDMDGNKVFDKVGFRASSGQRIHNFWQMCLTSNSTLHLEDFFSFESMTLHPHPDCFSMIMEIYLGPIMSVLTGIDLCNSPLQGEFDEMIRHVLHLPTQQMCHKPAESEGVS